MTQFKFSSVGFKIVAVLFLAVFLAAGCSRGPLSVEEETTEPQLLQRTIDESALASLSATELYAEQIISYKTGGRLSLFDVDLDVPAGAVANDTVFSIRIPDPAVFFNEFGTDGLVFDEPVTVTMSYRDANLTGVDETTIRIGWFDERTGHFEDISCKVDYANKVVTGQLDHFSAYGLISD
ncbi:MAG: hypothetical protein OEW00_07815 [candidate division Zixibacteria bacterium]|nr:hypothetical protein [candidate division Zixibacteria bacterium]